MDEPTRLNPHEPQLVNGQTKRNAAKAETASLDDVFGRMAEQRKKLEQKRQHVPKRMSDAERDRFHRENLTRPPQNWNKPFPFK